VLDGLINIS